MHLNLRLDVRAVFPFAVLPVVHWSTHLCFSCSAILPMLGHPMLCVPPFPAGSCCNRHCFLMSLSVLVLVRHKAVIRGNREHFSVLKASKQTMPPSPFGFHVEWCQRFGAKCESRLPCFTKGKNYFPLFPPYFGKTVLGWLLVPRYVFNCSLCFFMLDGNGGCLLLLRATLQSTLDSTDPDWSYWKDVWRALTPQKLLLYLVIHSVLMSYAAVMIHQHITSHNLCFNLLGICCIW